LRRDGNYLRRRRLASANTPTPISATLVPVHAAREVAEQPTETENPPVACIV